MKRPKGEEGVCFFLFMSSFIAIQRSSLITNYPSYQYTADKS